MLRYQSLVIEPRVVQLPAIDIGARTKTAADTKVASSTAAAAAPAPASSAAPGTGGKGGKLPGIPLPNFSDSPQYVGKPHIAAPWRVEKHYRHRHFKESTEQRKQIEDMPRKDAGQRPAYVGRPADDPKTTAEKTSRQAQYKIKIIDESKKLASIIKKTTKEYESGGKPKVFDNGAGDLIVINPDANKNTLDTK